MTAIDIQRILTLLPHRYPFILVDKILEYKDFDYLVGLKNITINEPFFNGHFPQNPIMPGVLIIEALAQASAVLASLSRKPKPNHEFLHFFAGIDKARFKLVVRPGDQLSLHVKVLKHKQEFWRVEANAYVDDKLACSCELMSAAKEIKSDK